MARTPEWLKSFQRGWRQGVSGDRLFGMEVGDAGKLGQFTSGVMSEFAAIPEMVGRGFGFEGLETLGREGRQYWEGAAGDPDTMGEAIARLSGHGAGILGPAIGSGMAVQGAVRGLGAASGLARGSGALGRTIRVLGGSDDVLNTASRGTRIATRAATEPILELPYNLMQSQDPRGSMLSMSNEFLGTDFDDSGVNRFLADSALSSTFGAAMPIAGDVLRYATRRPLAEANTREAVRQARKLGREDKALDLEATLQGGRPGALFRDLPTATKVGVPAAAGGAALAIGDEDVRDAAATTAGVGVLVSMPGMRGKWRSRLIESVENMADAPRPAYMWVKDIEAEAKKRGVTEMEYSLFDPNDAVHIKSMDLEDVTGKAEPDMTRDQVVEALREYGSRMNQFEYGMTEFGDVRTLKDPPPYMDELRDEMLEKFGWFRNLGRIQERQLTSARTDHSARIIDSYSGGIPNAEDQVAVFRAMREGPLKGDPEFEQTVRNYPNVEAGTIEDLDDVPWAGDVADFLYDNPQLIYRHVEQGGDLPVVDWGNPRVTGNWNPFALPVGKKPPADEVRDGIRAMDEYLEAVPDEIRREIKSWKTPFARLQRMGGDASRILSVSRKTLDAARMDAKEMTALPDPYLAANLGGSMLPMFRGADRLREQGAAPIPFGDQVSVAKASPFAERHISTSVGKVGPMTPSGGRMHNPADWALNRNVQGWYRPTATMHGDGDDAFDIITEIQSDAAKVARDTGYTTGYGKYVPPKGGDQYLEEGKQLMQTASPYGMTKWHRLALRQAIQNAVNRGQRGIIIPRALQAARIEGYDAPFPWMTDLYENVYPAEVRKILNEEVGQNNWSAEVERVDVMDGPGLVVRISDEGAKKINEQGMRLPSAVIGAGVGAGAAEALSDDEDPEAQRAGWGTIAALTLGSAFAGPAFARFLRNRGVQNELIERVARRGYDTDLAELKKTSKMARQNRIFEAEKALFREKEARFRATMDEYLDQEPDDAGVRPGVRPIREIQDPGPLPDDFTDLDVEDQLQLLAEQTAWERANRQYNERLRIWADAVQARERKIAEGNVSEEDLPLLPNEPMLERVYPKEMSEPSLDAVHDPKNVDETMRLIDELRVRPEDREPPKGTFSEWLGDKGRNIVQKVFDSNYSLEQLAKEYGNEDVARYLSQLRGAEHAGFDKAIERAQQFQQKLAASGQEYDDVVKLAWIQRALEIMDWTSGRGLSVGREPREIQKLAGLNKDHLLEAEARMLGGRDAEGQWRNTALLDVTDDLRGMYRELLDRRYEAGTLGDDQYQALKDAGAAYVPFVRLLDQHPWLRNVEPSKSGVVQQSEKTMRQMDEFDVRPEDALAIEDPLNQYMLDAIATERIALRGQITRELQDMIDSYGGSDKELFMRKKLALKEVEGRARPAPNHIELVTRNRETGELQSRTYEIEDELLYRSLANVGRSNQLGTGALTQLARGLKQTQRIGITTPPGFGVRNLVRDTMIRNLQASGEELGKNIKSAGAGSLGGAVVGTQYEDPDGGMPPGMATLAGMLMGSGIGYNLPGFKRALDATFALAKREAVTKWRGQEWFDRMGLDEGSPEWDRYISEWTREGGFGAGWIVRDQQDADRVTRMILEGDRGKEVTGNVVLPDFAAAGASMRRAWRGDDKVGAAEDVVEALFPWMSTLGRAMENANRLVEFKAAREAGENTPEAIRRSRDVTLDFRRTGDSEFLRWVNQTTPFLNARLQGWRKLGLTAANKEGSEPLARRYMAATLGLGAPGVGLTLMMQDDPEWHEIPLYERNNFYTFKVPGVEGWLRLPKPHEFAVPSTMAERFLDWMYLKGTGQDRKAEETLRSGLAQMSTQLMGPDSLTPTIFRLPAELVSNYDFFRGRPIDPIDESFGAVLPSDQAEPRTSLFARQMGELINWKYMSPARIDHVIRSITGNMGSFALDTSTAAAEGRQPGKKNPLVGGFQTNFTARRQTEASFTNQMKRGERVYNSLRRARQAADFEKASKIFDDNREDLAFYVRYKKLNDGTLRDMRRMRRSLHDPRTSGDLSPEERRQLIAQLNERIASLISLTEGF